MDGTTLAAVMGHSLTQAAYDAYVGPFNDGLHAAQCTTVNRAAMFCAMVGEESGGLRWMEEIASGAEYEGRRDLGNTQPGDGKRFKGRGPIQLTGRANYGAFSMWAHDHGLVPTTGYFVNNPTLVSQPRWGFLAASWYWTVARVRLNSYADAGDIVSATRAINGGINGLADRRLRWKRALLLGTALLPTPQEDQLSAQFESDARARWPREDLLDRDLRSDLKDKHAELDQIRDSVVALTAKVDTLAASVAGLAARQA